MHKLVDKPLYLFLLEVMSGYHAHRLPETKIRIKILVVEVVHVRVPKD
jgi:hypothetical protein